MGFLDGMATSFADAYLRDVEWGQSDYYSVNNPHSFKYLIPNSSKVKLTPESMLEISVVYACINKISKTLASLPLEVKEKKGGIVKDRSDSSLFELLNMRPSTLHNVTPFVWKQTLFAWALRYEAGYAIIQRDFTGNAISLDLVHPSRVQATTDTKGNRIFRITINEADEKTLNVLDVSEDDMFYISGLGQGYVGLPISNLSKEAMGIAKAGERHQSTFFGNGLQLNAVLKTVQTLSPEMKDEIATQFKTKYSRGNSFEPAVLDQDLDIKTLSMSSVDAELLKTRQFQVEEIARFFDMPLTKIQHYSSGAQYNNVEQLNTEYANDTIFPWCVRFHDEAKRKLITKSKMFVEFDLWSLMRGDLSAISEFASKMLGKGANVAIMTVNEVRSKLPFHLDPLDDGDLLFAPVNVGTVDTARVNAELTNEKLRQEIDQGNQKQEEVETVVETVVDNESNQKAVNYIFQRFLTKERKFWENGQTDENKIKSFYIKQKDFWTESLNIALPLVGKSGDTHKYIARLWSASKQIPQHGIDQWDKEIKEIIIEILGE